MPPVTLKEIVINGVDRTSDLIRFAAQIGLDSATSGRYSVLFLTELYCHSMISCEINPFKVLAEINYLEGVDASTRTKLESEFVRPALRGLWHKHYLESNVPSLAKNLLNALQKYGLPDLERQVREIEASGEERYFSESDVVKIADEVVYKNYERRSDDGQLTGEWIVYAKHEDKNYYLCLGKHGMDDVIRQKIENVCVAEYPFINEILKRT